MIVKLIKLIAVSMQIASLPALVFVAMGADASSCAVTPEAAARAWLYQQESQPGTGSVVESDAVPGYAVERIMVDPSLGNRWAIVMNCLHPERPVLAVALPAEDNKARRSYMHATTFSAGPPPHSSLAAGVPPPSVAHTPVMERVATPSSPQKIIAAGSAPILVRAGDPVVLWNREPQLLLEVAAISLEYGHAGQVIHLRRSGQIATPSTTLTGVVRAAGSVELMP